MATKMIQREQCQERTNEGAATRQAVYNIAGNLWKLAAFLVGSGMRRGANIIFIMTD